MSTVEKASCFPNEGVPQVLSGSPSDGDIVRPAGRVEGPYYRYTTPAEPPPPAAPSWNAFEFTRRFTQAERIALRTLAKANAQAEDFLDLLDKAGMTGTMIRADDPDVLAAVQAFEAATLLDVGRAAIILGTGASP